MPSSNPDYSASAVNLKNPESVEALLKMLKKSENDLLKAEETLAGLPEYNAVMDARAVVANVEDEIRTIVEKEGSFQDPDRGIYAVKQRKVTMIYSVALVKSRLPELAGDIIKIEESVDKKAIESLIKDGFTTQEAVDQCGRPRESFQFIIETGDLEVFDTPGGGEIDTGA